MPNALVANRLGIGERSRGFPAVIELSKSGDIDQVGSPWEVRPARLERAVNNWGRCGVVSVMAVQEEVALVEGDSQRTYRAFFLAEYVPLLTIASAVSGDRAESEDIVQEAFDRAYRQWDQVQLYDDPALWVRRVTVNLALNRRRSLRRRYAAVLRLDRSHEPNMAEPDDEVWQAVGRLPGQQRSAVVLRYFEDRTLPEIAEVLGCTEATARVHLHRGRAALRLALDGTDGDDQEGEV